MKRKMMIIMGTLFVVIATASFYGGMKYQQSRRGQFNARSAQFTQRTNGGNRSIRGEIINADDKSITVKLTDNSSKIVLLSQNTVISKTGNATKDDLKTGIQVMIFGTDNTDGSMTSQNIQLNPTR